MKNAFRHHTLTSLVAELFNISETTAAEMHNGWRLLKPHELPVKYRQQPHLRVLARKLSVAHELTDRMGSAVNEPPKQISRSTDAYQLMKPILNSLPYEEFWIIILNRRNDVMAIEKISQGGVSGTVVDNKIVMSKCLAHLGSSCILVHNHPSGNLLPSKPDLDLTKKIKEAGKVLDIQVLDHLIIGHKTGYRSMADEGEL